MSEVEFYVETEGNGVSAQSAIAEAIGNSPDIPLEEGMIVTIQVVAAWTDAEGKHHAKVSAIKTMDPAVLIAKKEAARKKHLEEQPEGQTPEPSDYEGDTIDPVVVAMHQMKEVADADEALAAHNSTHIDAPEPSTEPPVTAEDIARDKEEYALAAGLPQNDHRHKDEADIKIPHDDLTHPDDKDTEVFDLPHDMQLAEEEMEDDFQHAVHDLGEDQKKKKDLNFAKDHTDDSALPAPQPGGTEDKKTGTA